MVTLISSIISSKSTVYLCFKLTTNKNPIISEQFDSKTFQIFMSFDSNQSKWFLFEMKYSHVFCFIYFLSYKRATGSSREIYYQSWRINLSFNKQFFHKPQKFISKQTRRLLFYKVNYYILYSKFLLFSIHLTQEP